MHPHMYKMHLPESNPAGAADHNYGYISELIKITMITFITQQVLI